MALLMFTLPGDKGWNVISRIGLAIVTAYPLATIVIGMVIEEQKRRHKATQDLKQRLAYEMGLVACARHLQSNQPDHEAIPHALEILRESIDLDRAYLFENFHDPLDGLCSRQLYEACSTRARPQGGNPMLQHVPWEPVFPPGVRILKPTVSSSVRSMTIRPRSAASLLRCRSNPSSSFRFSPPTGCTGSSDSIQSSTPVSG